MKPPTELGLVGKGVEIPRIKELDKAAAEYQEAKLARCERSQVEVSAKTKLIMMVKKHADKLLKDEMGTITYRNDDLVVTMKHGKDSLSVKSAEDEDEEEEQE